METRTPLKESTRRVAELLCSQPTSVDNAANILGTHKRTVYRALREIRESRDLEVVRRGEQGAYTYAVEEL